MGAPMVVYDKDHTFFATLDQEYNKQVHPRLEKVIIEQGVMGVKGYFHVIVFPEKMKTNGLIKVELNEKILPRQPW